MRALSTMCLISHPSYDLPPTCLPRVVFISAISPNHLCLNIMRCGVQGNENGTTRRRLNRLISPGVWLNKNSRLLVNKLTCWQVNKAFGLRTMLERWCLRGVYCRADGSKWGRVCNVGIAKRVELCWCEAEMMSFVSHNGSVLCHTCHSRS